ncbi:hypothetical protein [Brevibacillus sp. NL20B1]|uniref:hypothetical protein n=1 Tax=Brevibacillus sp. NL20B1 TaxID=2829799 RepID=UPI001BAD943E|nr:hypothetical protein [Brevibacillus sp. NL20B1]
MLQRGGIRDRTRMPDRVAWGEGFRPAPPAACSWRPFYSRVDRSCPLGFLLIGILCPSPSSLPFGS